MYQPLNHHRREIRLLRIQPREKDSRIEARLTTYTLPLSVPDDHSESQYGGPEYDALSYEWGDPNGARYSILLNGQPF
jgi:hypothetical protein